jgi:hypothetical protein
MGGRRVTFGWYANIALRYARLCPFSRSTSCKPSRQDTCQLAVVEDQVHNLLGGALQQEPGRVAVRKLQAWPLMLVSNSGLGRRF